MSKEKSGFLNQGSFGWGIGLGITVGAVGYLLSRRPLRETSPKKSSRPPIHSSSEADSASLAKGLQEAADGAGEAPVHEIQDQIIKGGEDK